MNQVVKIKIRDGIRRKLLDNSLQIRLLLVSFFRQESVNFTKYLLFLVKKKQYFIIKILLFSVKVSEIALVQTEEKKNENGDVSFFLNCYFTGLSLFE